VEFSKHWLLEPLKIEILETFGGGQKYNCD
jgi:hypothetical protein